MIERLNSETNPNFFMLSYDKSSMSVSNFLCIPKHFFITRAIEMRKPLALTARRAGWVGCNIVLEHIPESGKFFFVRDGVQLPQKSVLNKWKETLFLREEQKLSSKGWMIDILLVIDKIGKSEFTLDDIYQYEQQLARLHPENFHIKEKIRQQLQILRDKNYHSYVSRGMYSLIKMRF